MIDARRDDHATTDAAAGGLDYVDARRVRVERLRDHRARYLAQISDTTRRVPQRRGLALQRARLATVVVAIPFLLLATLSAVADSVHLISSSPGWAATAYWATVASLVLGVATVAGGGIYGALSPRGTHDRRVAALLAIGSVGVLSFAGVSWSAWGDVVNSPNAPAAVLGVMAGGIAVVIGGVVGELAGARRMTAPAPVPAYAPATRRRRAVVTADDTEAAERIAARA